MSEGGRPRHAHVRVRKIKSKMLAVMKICSSIVLNLEEYILSGEGPQAPSLCFFVPSTKRLISPHILYYVDTRIFPKIN